MATAHRRIEWKLLVLIAASRCFDPLCHELSISQATRADKAAQGCKHWQMKALEEKHIRLPGTQLRIWMPTSALVGCNAGAWISPISPRIHSTVPGVWAGTQEVSVCECGSPDVRVSPSAFLEEENAIFLSRRLRLTHQVKHAARSVFSGERFPF